MKSKNKNSPRCCNSRISILEVLSKKNYFILLLITSVFMFAIFYALTLATTTDHDPAIFIMMNGVNYTAITLVLFILISLLFGVFISLLVYKIKASSKGKKSLNIIGGSGGLIAGIFGAGCPMCGSAVFALFGAPLALFFMPFKGLELRVLSIILMLASIYFVSKSSCFCKMNSEAKK